MPPDAVAAPRRRLSTLLLVTLGVVALVGAADAFGPFLLWNRTDSEPPGLYAKSFGQPAHGRLIAFWAPPAAFPSAADRMGYLRRVPILKEVVAMAGDQVCTRGAVLTVNGRPLASVLQRDPRGQTLPQWRGCRRLADGEYFVFSGRIPNSFDSRYYGPVPSGAVLGVYRPLHAAAAAPGGV